MSLRITPEQEAEMRSLHAKGWTLVKIAKHMGVSPPCVWYRVNCETGGYRYKKAEIKQKEVPFVPPRVTDPSLLRKITAGR